MSKDILKKSIGVLSLFLLTGGSVCGVVYGVKYSNLLQDERLQNNEQIVQTNNELRQALADLQARYDELKANYDKLFEDNTTNLEQIEEYKTQIDDLTTRLNNALDDIDSLIAEKESLIANKNAMQEDIDAYILREAELNAEILSLNNEITRLNGLMADYEDIKNQASQVIFYVGDKNVQTDAVRLNEKVTSIPQSTNAYRIDGWKLKDGTSVDPLSYPITENTIFYADYVAKHKVSYVYGTEETSSYVAEDSFVFAIPAEKEGWTFEGWFVGETKYTLEDTYNLTADVVFTAQYYKEVALAQVKVWVCDVDEFTLSGDSYTLAEGDEIILRGTSYCEFETGYTTEFEIKLTSLASFTHTFMYKNGEREGDPQTFTLTSTTNGYFHTYDIYSNDYIQYTMYRIERLY